MDSSLLQYGHLTCQERDRRRSEITTLRMGNRGQSDKEGNGKRLKKEMTESGQADEVERYGRPNISDHA